MSKNNTKDKQMQCRLCKQELKSQSGMVRHFKVKHPKAKIYRQPKKPKKTKQTVVKPAIGRKETDSGKRLTPPQEMFCQLYASYDEFFANGVQSYIEAYGINVGHGEGFTTYDTCRNAAYRLLTNANVLARINEIFETRGLNDTFVDKQLEFIITQNAELRTKLGGVQEYNKLKARITEKVDHTFSDLKDLSDEQLAKKKASLLSFFKKQ